MIFDFEYRKLTSKEITDIKINAKLLEQLLDRCPERCGNPDCKYPLPRMDNYRVPGFGEVCQLCYQMYQAVYKFPHFVRLHKEWKREHPDANGNTEMY